LGDKPTVGGRDAAAERTGMYLQRVGVRPADSAESSKQQKNIPLFRLCSCGLFLIDLLAGDKFSQIPARRCLGIEPGSGGPLRWRDAPWPVAPPDWR
jgi:hypothetical protein